MQVNGNPFSEVPRLTPQQLQILQHSLGVDQYGRGARYRNHFCAGDADEPICRSLIALYYMKQHHTTEVFPDFNCSVTEVGILAMLAESPKPPVLTRSQQRYRQWLRVADIFPDWGFGDWLRNYKRASE